MINMNTHSGKKIETKWILHQPFQYHCLHLKSEVGTQLYETMGLEGEINLAIRKLKDWAAPRPVEKNLLTLSDTVYIKPEPLGVVLIIGAWNYPWAVTIQPLIGAIAAGTVACMCVWVGERAVYTVHLHACDEALSVRFHHYFCICNELWEVLWS